MKNKLKRIISFSIFLVFSLLFLRPAFADSFRIDDDGVGTGARYANAIVTTVKPDGTSTTHAEEKTVMVFNKSYWFFDISTGGNSFSATQEYYSANGDKSTQALNGTINYTTNSVTFKIITTMINIPGPYSTEEGKTILTKNYSGTLHGGTITGYVTASYSSSSKLCNPSGWCTYTTATGNFSGETFTAYYITEETIGENNPPPDSKFGKAKQDPQSDVGEPINSVNGNMYMIASDLTIPGKGMNFEFIRTYNSLETTSGPLGRGWTHSYNVYLTEPSSNLVKIKDEQAKGYLFTEQDDGTFIAQRGEYSTLTKDSNNYIWTQKDGKQYLFDLSGKLIQIKDRNANAINLTYDAQNRLTKIIDTAGRAVNLTYDTNNRITKLADCLNRNFTYNYDTNGNLTKVTNPAGNSVIYEYDTNNRLEYKTDAANCMTSFSYNENGLCYSSSGESNFNWVHLSFDPGNKITTVTNSDSYDTLHCYNNDGLITKVVDPEGNEVQSEWDENLNLVSRTDALGNTTFMEYDTKGNLTKVTDALGNITQFTYEANFNLIKTATDAQGNATIYDYDAKGNLIKLTDALGSTTAYTYNPSGKPLTITNALGKTTTFTYDSSGNLASSKDALGNTTNFSYDAVGNLTQTKDAKGNITKFSYDLLNHLTQTIYADNSMISYGYDAVGNRISVSDALSNTTTYTYDQDHNVESVSDPQGNTIDYWYTFGGLDSIGYQNVGYATYYYNNLGRVKDSYKIGELEASYQYDAAGNRISVTNTKGKITNRQYDSLNRLTKIIYPDATSVTYTYDSLGRRTNMTDSQGITNYVYDKLGRLTKVDGPASNDTVEYTYDKLGNRLTMKDPDGKTTHYAYDASSRLTSIIDPQGKVTNYSYDSLNNLTQTTLPNSTSVSYVYDNLSRLTKLSNLKGSSKLSEFIYTYDLRGLKTSATTLDGRIDYTYDTKAQLISETKTGSTNNYSISYTYDPAGNRLTMVNNGTTHNYTYNDFNQLTKEEIITSSSGQAKKITVTGTVSDASGIQSITVNGIAAIVSGNNFTCSDVILSSGSNTITVTATDNAGNTSTKSIKVTYQASGSSSEQIIYTYDELGNLIKKQKGTDIVNLSYDAENRLKTFISPSQSLIYNYDGAGKRISLKSGATTTSYLYDGMNVILERQANTTTVSYIRNPDAQGGIGGIVSSQLAVGSSQNYYHYDGIGSAVNLTNASGTITQSCTYDAFGNVLTQTGSINNSHQFLSKELDVSGLVYFGCRYYDPSIGRFISRDPLGMIDGLNEYLYCRNDPVNWVDPFGLEKEKRDERSSLEKMGDYLSYASLGLNMAALSSLVGGPGMLPIAEGISIGAAVLDAATTVLYFTDAVINENNRSGVKAGFAAVTVVLDVGLSSSVAVKPAFHGSRYYSTATGRYVSNLAGFRAETKPILIDWTVGKTGDVVSDQVPKK